MLKCTVDNIRQWEAKERRHRKLFESWYYIKHVKEKPRDGYVSKLNRVEKDLEAR